MKEDDGWGFGGRRSDPFVLETMTAGMQDRHALSLRLRGDLGNLPVPCPWVVQGTRAAGRNLASSSLCGDAIRLFCVQRLSRRVRHGTTGYRFVGPARERRMPGRTTDRTRPLSRIAHDDQRTQ